MGAVPAELVRAFVRVCQGPVNGLVCIRKWAGMKHKHSGLLPLSWVH